MKPKAFEYLTFSIVNPNLPYFPRKYNDQLCLIVDTETKKVYPVPKNEGHIEHALKILGIEFKDIIVNKLEKEVIHKLEKLIPSNIRVRTNGTGECVYSIVSGVCGIEIGYGIKYRKEHIDFAHSIVHSFVKKGELEYKLVEDKKVYKYCRKDNY